MRSTLSIAVAAPPDLVFDLVRDVERWPALLPHYDRAAVEERRVDGSVVATFVARRPLFPFLGLGLPVAWRSRAWSEPPDRLRFVHLAGATRGMDVTWRIEPTPDGCRVSIDHAFRRSLEVPLLGPMLGDETIPAIVGRLFVGPIAGRTLATFKAIAEAVASGRSRSEPAPMANLRS